MNDSKEWRPYTWPLWPEPLDEHMPTPQKIEAAKQRIREKPALWVWEHETYWDRFANENGQLMREIVEQAKEEAFFAWGL